MSKRLFADISDNNGPVDLAAYAGAGHRMIAIKASEGVSYTNPRHAVATAEAHRLGLVVVHYHFCRLADGSAVIAEARHFNRTVASHFEVGDILVLDVEDRGAMSQDRLAAYVAAFDRALVGHLGVSPYVYASRSWLTDIQPPIRVGSRRFWVASYGAGVPRLGFHRHRWAHQFTDGSMGAKPHEMAGIGRCDISRLTAYGSADLTVRRRRRRRAGLKVAR